MENIKIKDFILTEEIVNNVKTTKPKKPVEYSYEIIYENDYDFILKRTTAKTEKLLVVLVSQAQCYFKDVKQNKLEDIENESQITRFVCHMNGDDIHFEKLQWTPFYRWGNKPNFSDFLAYMSEYKLLANKKINPFDNRSLAICVHNDPQYLDDMLFCNKVLSSFTNKTIKDFDTYDRLRVIKSIKECKIDINLINRHKQVLMELGESVVLRILRNGHLQTIVNEYGCDLKHFLTFLLYTIKYRNGLEIETSDFYLSWYVDYLRMQKEMYGKVKEKYPLYWLSEKHQMNKKYNAWKELQRKIGFSLNQEDYKQYEFEDDMFCVIVPQMSVDIIDEAQQQQHCVASYVDRVANRETHIMFIRLKDTPDESLLTVEVNKNNEICQVRGFQNRTYTLLEYAFMKKWANDKGLKLIVEEPKCLNCEN